MNRPLLSRYYVDCHGVLCFSQRMSLDKIFAFAVDGVVCMAGHCGFHIRKYKVFLRKAK